MSLFTTLATIIAVWVYVDRQTLIQCDSCRTYTPKSGIRYYAGDPVCPRCRQEMATDPRQ